MIKHTWEEVRVGDPRHGYAGRRPTKSFFLHEVVRDLIVDLKISVEDFLSRLTDALHLRVPHHGRNRTFSNGGEIL